MKMQVGRWGDTLAIPLPEALAEKFGVAEGAEVDLASVEALLAEIAEREEQRARKRAAIASLRDMNWVLPPDWKIDRNDPDMRG